MLKVTNILLHTSYKTSPVLSAAINCLPTPQRRSMSSASPNVILHIGSGAFHRAHQAWYLHRLIESGDKDWSLALSNIRQDMNPVLEALAAQNGVYTLETVTPKGERSYETIRSIKKIVPWDKDIKHLVQTGAAPETKIVSFTVTEGGYYLDEHQRLDMRNPELASDVKGGRTTIYGAISAILEQRMKSGTGKLTLQSCDNLRSNGDRFKAGMTQFLELQKRNDLKQWFEANTSCPNAMVDRITPRVTPDVNERVLKATGFDDKAPIMSESFIQWVIEDEFCAGRPQWEKVGAEIVHNVIPYEEAKIRILNATHSQIAWAGTLIGKQYIHEGTTDPDINAMAREYITNDVIPCLLPSPLDLANYRDVTLDRFSNPYILDTNQRVAADGFTKMTGFIAPTLRQCFTRKAEPNATAVLPALFFRFLERWHNNQLPFTYQDGVMDPNVAHGFFESADPLKAFLSDTLIWGSLASSQDMERVVRAAVARVDEWVAKRT